MKFRNSLIFVYKQFANNFPFYGFVSGVST